jgi:GT2 family glycosyltransferase/glycosyltransferase involved in cell wall biosynthesis
MSGRAKVSAPVEPSSSPTNTPTLPSDGPVPPLEATMARLERELAYSRSQLNLAAELRRATTEELARTQNELRILHASPPVWLAITASRGARRVARAVRRRVRSTWKLARSAPGRIVRRVQRLGLRASSDEEAALASTLRASLPGAAQTRGPLVSIVILNRDGRRHLERCLRAIASTAYRDLEVIVVDNASSDGSPELVEALEMPFPIRLVRNDTNRSFSEANNQALSIATGELICFLNNDVDPITDEWLGYLVETLEARQAVAVGARLVYPRHRGGARGGARFPDLSLQHAGVDFERGHGIPLARALGAGDDPTTPWAGRVADTPAVTAACLLVRLDAFQQVGGFSAAYNYGFEDVDLCLKLQAAGGRLVYDGRAVLWHHESATRASDRAAYSARSAANRATFNGLWGPRVFRAAFLDALRGGHRFSSTAFHLALAGVEGESGATPDDPTAGSVGEALRGCGWRISRLAAGRDWEAADPSLEAVLVLDDSLDIRQLPRSVVTMAWIRGAAESWLDRTWFDEFDLIFTSSEETVRQVQERTAKVARLLPSLRHPGEPGADPAAATANEIQEALVRWASATRYGLRIGVTGWDVIDQWGDYHFARGLQRALERQGHPTRLHFLPDWASPTAARDDVAVHLFGLKEGPTHPGQVNLLWQISHPDLASPDLYQRYDHVFVASDIFASRMADRVSVPVTPLHQATDPQRFQPTPGGPHHELLFVASSRKVHRRIVDDLADTTHDLAIYGRHWTPDLVAPRFVKGEIVPNTELARYYSAADIVLNDHWDDMRIEGFISNRIYDALACGAFVLSDEVDGIEAEFEGAVVTYRTKAELEPLINRYLADPAERARLAERGRAIVIVRHTFEQRARAICEVAEARVRARPASIEDVATPAPAGAAAARPSDAGGDPEVAA